MHAKRHNGYLRVEAVVPDHCLSFIWEGALILDNVVHVL